MKLLIGIVFFAIISTAYCAKLNEACTSDTSCAEVANSYCLKTHFTCGNGTCACQTNFAISKTNCVAQLTNVGDACDSANDKICNQMTMICGSDKKCACNTALYETSGTTCVMKTQMAKDATCATTLDCMTGLTCSSTKCVCGTTAPSMHYSYRNSMCVGLMIDQVCESTGDGKTCDLTAGLTCNTTTKRCSCTDANLAWGTYVDSLGVKAFRCGYTKAMRDVVPNGACKTSTTPAEDDKYCMETYLCTRCTADGATTDICLKDPNTASSLVINFLTIFAVYSISHLF